MSVSLVEVMAAATERLAPLAGESAGHVVLAVADQIVETPRLVRASEVHLEPNGAVKLAGATACDEAQCEQNLRTLLDGLMLVAHSGGAGLVRAGRRPATGNLRQLINELEVALIPANRAAARRSLARLHRETERAREAGALKVDALARATALGRQPVVPMSGATPASPLIAPVQPSAAAVVRAPPLTAEAPAAAVAANEEIVELDEMDLEIDIEVDADAPPTASPRALWTDTGVDLEPAAAIEHTVPLEVFAPPRVEPKVERAHESDTPAEPVLQRRRSGWPAYVHEPPDIHRTPYLGSLVELLPASAEEVPASPSPQWEATATEDATSMQSGVESVDDASLDPFEGDESNTDPMLPAIEWLSSAEVEEIPRAASVLPRPQPLPERPKPPRVQRTSDVSELLETFQVGVAEPEPRLCRDLTELAGLSRTPPPVAAQRSGTSVRSSTTTAVSERAEPGADDAIRPSPTLVVSGS